MCVCVFVCVFVHYYKLVINYQHLTLQENNYINLWLHRHQQSKYTNKEKYSQLWAMEHDQFCWEARRRATVLESLNQSLWSSTNKSCYFGH